MTFRQWTLNAPAAMVFIADHPFDHGHYTIVISAKLHARAIRNVDLPNRALRSRLGSPPNAASELMYKPTPIALFTLGGVVLCWMVFAAVFLLRKRPEKAEAKRDRMSLLGIFLQMCAYF